MIDLNDNELIQGIRNKDQRIFERVYNRYWDVLYMHCFRMLGDDEDALDVIQDIFCSLWEKSDTLAIEDNLGGYLYAMARFRVLNKIRGKKIGDKFLNGLIDHSNTAPERVLDHIYYKELAELLDREIDHLPTKMKEVFILSRKEYLSHKEISQQLGIADTTVKKQINNALKLLKLKLDKLVVLFF